MSFICQLAHHPERLDLGGEGRVMFVFWCLSDPGMCEVWDPDAGSNAVLVLTPDELTGVVTDLPDAERLPCLRVESWIAQDDGVPPARLEIFFDHRYKKVDSLWNVQPGTRLGGAPYWPETPVCEWNSDWAFVLQIAGSEWFDPPAPSADELGCTVLHQHDNRTFTRKEPSASRRHAPPGGIVVTDDGKWCIERFSDFVSYVFLRRKFDSIEGRLFMQR